MDPDSETELHGTRKVREEGAGALVAIPESALERSALEVGEQVMIGSIEDGSVSMMPWTEEFLSGADRD